MVKQKRVYQRTIFGSGVSGKYLKDAMKTGQNAIKILQKNRSVKSKLKSLDSWWKEIYLLLSYHYSFNQFQLHSCDRVHCDTYVSGGQCSHEHRRTVCQKYNECFNLFIS